ncbi:MAG: translation initiation factor IF-3 [Rhodospirillales bacterium]|nr:translation initiation factor IF-3 [Rhodospirillales bacterium]MCB9964602.1 translation initiation factor IF-3 [Rhodospirillales bacterium]
MTIAPRPPRGAPRRPEDPTRINDRIRAPEVRLIGPEGEMIGVVSAREALRQAEEYGLDLVEISPNAEPPVCKILDYGKYKYEQQKKAAEARKHQKTVEVKEIKVRPAIGEHDYQVKYKAARKFLEDGNKVKVTLRLRGREMAHQDLVMEVMNRLKQELSDLSKVDMEPKMEGRQVVMVLSAAAAVPS